LPLSDIPKGTNTYIDANIFLFIAFKEKHFEESKDFLNRIKEYKLMTRDALHISVMKSNGISHITTGDEDFRQVPGVTVWAPVR
jgi:predicted nucleic acid-binding protein